MELFPLDQVLIPERRNGVRPAHLPEREQAVRSPQAGLLRLTPAFSPFGAGVIFFRNPFKRAPGSSAREPLRQTLLRFLHPLARMGREELRRAPAAQCALRLREALCSRAAAELVRLG